MTGKIDLHQFVDLLSTKAAKLFGMFPAKGTLQLGSDADIVVWDPNFRGTITAADHLMNTDYDGFEGFQILGRPSLVISRGMLAARDGEFIGQLGHGRQVPRERVG